MEETPATVPPELRFWVGLLVLGVLRVGERGKGETNERAGADSHGRWGLADRAVGGGHDGVAVDQGATTEVRAARRLQGDDEGEVTGGSSNTADNLDALLAGDGGSDGDGGECEGGEADHDCGW